MHLILEVTRKCNLECEHCLRGLSQELDMPKSVIDTIVPQLPKDGSLTLAFTGGEPSLNPDIIEYFMEQCDRHRVYWSEFYIATNGNGNKSHRWLDILCALYDNSCDAQHSSVEISNTQWHEASRTPEEWQTFSRGVVNHLEFVSNRSKSRVEEDTIIREGNADTIMSCGRAPDYEAMDGLYINVLGNLTYSCNLSYESQDKYSLGHVSNLDLAKEQKTFDRIEYCGKGLDYESTQLLKTAMLSARRAHYAPRI